MGNNTRGLLKFIREVAGNSGTALVLGALILASFAALPAQANLVFNGGFSSCTATTSSGTSSAACPTSNFAISASATSLAAGGTNYNLANWTIDNPDNLHCVVVSPYTNDHLCGTGWTGGSANLQMFALAGASPDGGNYVLLDGDAGNLYNATLSQTVNLTAGQTYSLSFYQTAGQQAANTGASTDYWRVVVGSQTFGSATQNQMTVASQSLTTPLWQQVVYTFTATVTGATTVSFTSMGATGVPPFLFLDGVNLVATPEPGAFGLVGLALLAVPIARRRFAKRA